MNNINMANMGGPMGGPVGAPMPMMNNGAGVVPQGASRPRVNDRAVLNTYIYEYFLRYGMFDCARAILNSDSQVKIQKGSPGGRRDENGLGDDPMDADSKDDMDQKRPNDLPAPQLPAPLPDSCFLYEWFYLFWDMLEAQKGKGSGQVQQYVNHTQQHQSRARQEAQQQILRQMRPDLNNSQYQMMRIQNSGMNGMNINMAIKPGQNPLPRTAMANSQNNPQAMHMLQQKASQMQRDPSDMDGNRVRPASPGSTENAPSPKRPRLDGAGGPFNPNQGVMMPNGRPAGQGMPGQQVGNGPNSQAQQLLIQHGINPDTLNPDQLQAFTSQTSHVQAKTIATYAANLHQHHGNQMPNKPMPNASAPQGQGSPMVPQGPDGAAIASYYNSAEMGGPGGMRQGPAGAQPGGGSNHALQDYQMQLMLLEQQNKRRLMMARQEQDVGSGMPRGDSGGPGGPAGPNAQPFQGASPQGGRSGASPNPADQMKRGNQQLNGNPANMGSPAPESAQSRDSPSGTINFMNGHQMDPMSAPNFYKGMNGMDGSMVATAPMNGMRPPSSHPSQPFNGQMNPQVLTARQHQAHVHAQAQATQAAQAAAAQGNAPINWQAGPNGQPMPPQGGPQPSLQGTPQQRSMPPPSAPAAATNNVNSRNATSSPQTANAAPPTPQQSTKAAPKKKDPKNAKNKATTQKKSNTNLNAAPTPVAEPAPEPEPPTPATPITPANPPNFNPKAQQNGGGAQMVPVNGQPAVPPPAAAAPVAPQHPDPSQSFIENMDFGSMEFANPLNSSDVLNDFDFDSFLHDGNGDDVSGFDFTSTTFMEGEGIGAE